ncbi:MAG TPA: formimidoylglutamate deiminase [Pyrinomonadaceae bacterium]|jgi:formimidoylglutamate deiminase|nr:formimidoylglutamate deiminase [Pyrinomonadaceae bacterium]
MADEENNVSEGATVYVPDLLYTGRRFESGLALVCGPAGDVLAVECAEGAGGRVVRLRGRALLPGMVNAHSHAFQRVIRGRTEFRSGERDSFWTWREAMYAAASALSPEDLYDASRMAFTEMALAGITAVGEFHYLHRTPEGDEYTDPNLLARCVVRAARDVGVRVALLRVAYARAGFRRPPDERQKRFIEPDPARFIANTEALLKDFADEGEHPRAWVGVAPHSVRAVPLEYLKEVCAFAGSRRLPVHMHVAEQPAENAACLEETGRTPVRLLADEGLLGPRFTAVHAVHVTPEEVQALAAARSIVCACPTTERNLGDGVVPADRLLAAGVPVALGTDSHTQVDLLEDARELEYHLRLTRLERNVLAPVADDEGSPVSALAARLFDCATRSGASSIGFRGGELEPGRPADFFTVDLNDPSVAGADSEDLLPAVVFSLSRAAVREVAVGGRLVVEDGRHAAQGETIERFKALRRKLRGA